MKQFQDWWKNKSTCDFTCFECYSTGLFCTNQGWKAALEWIKSRSVHRLISVNEIEEELKDE